MAAPVATSEPFDFSALVAIAEAQVATTPNPGPDDDPTSKPEVPDIKPPPPPHIDPEEPGDVPVEEPGQPPKPKRASFTEAGRIA